MKIWMAPIIDSAMHPVYDLAGSFQTLREWNRVLMNSRPTNFGFTSE
jgi:hypothetical protein